MLAKPGQESHATQDENQEDETIKSFNRTKHN